MRSFFMSASSRALSTARGLMAPLLSSRRSDRISASMSRSGLGKDRLLTMTRILLVSLLAALPLVATARIERSAAEVLAFKRHNPCPATGLRRGACPGWEVDHVRPLCMGGPDTQSNMQWLTIADHRFKTLVDVRECRKYRKMADMPAREALPKE